MHVKGTPAERRIGRVRVDVGLGPIGRMFDAHNWQAPENAGGAAVFAGRATEVIENIERETGVDPEGFFNLDAHVYDVDSGHPVPYLEVSATVTRNGVAVLSDVPLVPVARTSKGVAGLHYGNNVALEPTGTYHVAVRIAPGPISGTDLEEQLDYDLDFASTAEGEKVEGPAGGRG